MFAVIRLLSDWYQTVVRLVSAAVRLVSAVIRLLAVVRLIAAVVRLVSAVVRLVTAVVTLYDGFHASLRDGTGFNFQVASEVRVFVSHRCHQLRIKT